MFILFTHKNKNKNKRKSWLGLGDLGVDLSKGRVARPSVKARRNREGLDKYVMPNDRTLDKI